MLSKSISISKVGHGFFLTDGEVLACCNITGVEEVASEDSANEGERDSRKEQRRSELDLSEDSELSEHSEDDDFLADLAGQERASLRPAEELSESDEASASSSLDSSSDDSSEESSDDDDEPALE